MRTITRSIRWFQSRLEIRSCLLVIATYLLVTFLVQEVEQAAMIECRPIVYHRHALFQYRRLAGFPKSTLVDILRENGLFRYRGSRGGQATRARRASRAIVQPQQTNSAVEIPGTISTVIGHRPTPTVRRPFTTKLSALQSVKVEPCRPMSNVCQEFMPSLYVSNASALTKPHAVEQLASELHSNNIDIAVITETHFKQKHSDSVIAVPDYAVFRRDRLGRRGGGVAVYVRSALQSSVWSYPANDCSYECFGCELRRRSSVLCIILQDHSTFPLR